MNKTKYAVFTMDIESFADTECIRHSGCKVKKDLLDGFDVYMDILNKHDIKCTMFTVGNLAPKISSSLQTCMENGHRLALHNYKHIAPMDIEPEHFREKIRSSKQKLEQMFGTEISGFRAPCFSLDNQRLEILKELGFKYDSSHLGFKAARHTVDLDLSNFKEVRSNILCDDNFYEFGLSKEKVFGMNFPISGGGYVRISNWTFVKSLILQHIKQNDYYVFYLHPFELTHEKIPLVKKLNFRDKYYINKGISTYPKKVERIIKMLKKNNYKFVTFEELYDILQKENTAKSESFAKSAKNIQKVKPPTV